MRRRALLLVVLAAGGCEWFSTMADPPSIQPHEYEPYRAPDHAVPLGGLPEFDLATVEGVLTNPRTADPSSLASGEAYYRNFCYVCHGLNGRGGGPVSRVFPAIPAINTPRVAGLSDAYLFALISKGRGLMPDYSRIPVTARWDLVNYMRTLPSAGEAGNTTAPAAAAPSGADTTASGGAR
jgi:mono/diheme cytochrome c family protein